MLSIRVRFLQRRGEYAPLLPFAPEPFLLADALHRSLRSEITSFVVIVDAKDESAREFYEREGFLRLLEQPMRLFRPMADIAQLFK
jgi:hypothetical protein